MNAASGEGEGGQFRLMAEADRWAFAFFLLLGGAGIFWLKSLDISPWWVTAWPVAMLVIYAAFAVSTPKYRLRADQAGDNCYYLGLLYTMGSLSYSLYEFSEAEATEALITNFGIALFTTIVGLFLRILLNQFRFDPLEVERQARIELSEASTRLRSELDTLTDEFNNYARGLRQSVDEAAHETREQLAAQLQAAAAIFTEAVETHTARTEELAARQQTMGASLDEAATALDARLRALLGRFDEIDIPRDLLSRTLAPLVEEIGVLATKLKEYQRLDRRALSDASKFLSKTVEGARLFDERVSSLTGHFDRLDALGPSLDRMATASDALSQNLDASAARFRAVLDGLSTVSEDRVTAATEELSRVTEAYVGELTALSERTRARIGELLDPITAFAGTSGEQLRQLEASIGQTLAAIRAHGAALEAELEASRGATLQVQKALESMATLVTEKLR